MIKLSEKIQWKLLLKWKQVTWVKSANQKPDWAGARWPLNAWESCEGSVWLGPGWIPASCQRQPHCTHSWSKEQVALALFCALLAQSLRRFAEAMAHSELDMCWHQHLAPLLAVFTPFLAHPKSTFWQSLLHQYQQMFLAFFSHWNGSVLVAFWLVTHPTLAKSRWQSHSQASMQLHAFSARETNGLKV